MSRQGRVRTQGEIHDPFGGAGGFIYVAGCGGRKVWLVNAVLL